MIPITDLSCFQPSYQKARQSFLRQCDNLKETLIQASEAVTHPLPGPDREPLTLDWIFLGQDKEPERILVLISGTHGVEGFAGSAIQCHYLPALEHQLREDPRLGVLLLHAFNPWGFAWLRRYDHEGIDLNRNFIDFSDPASENPKYKEIHDDLFCAMSKPIEQAIAYWQSKLGTSEFEAVITRGQYQYVDGLFYGGTAPAWSRQILEQICQVLPLQHAKRIAAIDLHTGLGPFGHGEVINDHSPNTTGFKFTSDWYGPNAQSALLGESCSPPKTGLLDYFWHRLIAERGSFVTLEYGTYSLNKLIHVSCEELRYHNQTRQNEQARELDAPAVTALRDFFYPQDHTWQQLVLFRAGQVIDLALRGILA